MVGNKMRRQELMKNKFLKVNIAIHTCASVSAVAAGAWTAIPIVGPLGLLFGFDTFFLTPLTIGMVIDIGKLYGRSYQFSSLMAGMRQVIGMVLGRNIVRGLLSLIPVVNPGIIATVAFALQETIGWGTYILLERGEDVTPSNLQRVIKNEKPEIDRLRYRARDTSGKIKKTVTSLPPDIRQRYKVLEEKAVNQKLPEEERIATQEEMSNILQEYMEE
jgi:uncharacterized protein (DUF697 family)